MRRPHIKFFIKNGLAKSTLKSFFPTTINLKQVIPDLEAFVKHWDCRSTPSKVFSSEMSEIVRQRRIFAIVLIEHYAALRKSVRLIEGFEQSKKRTLSQVIDTLCLYYNAYVLTLENYPCTLNRAALGFNASVNLIKGFNNGQIVLVNCPCGRPLLVRVQDIYTDNMNVKRDFFRCPWCNRMDSNLKAYLEERLYASEQWAKRSQHK